MIKVETPDLGRLLSLARGEAYAKTLFDAGPLYAGDPLFTIVLLVFRDHYDHWTLQLLEATGGANNTHNYRVGNVFEYWGEPDPSNDGGWVRIADNPDELADALTLLAAKMILRREEMIEHKAWHDREKAKERAEAEAGA